MAFDYDAAERLLDIMAEDEAIVFNVEPADVVVLAFCVKFTADAVRAQQDKGLNENATFSILAIDAAWDSVMATMLDVAEKRQASRN